MAKSAEVESVFQVLDALTRMGHFQLDTDHNSIICDNGIKVKYFMDWNTSMYVHGDDTVIKVKIVIYFHGKAAMRTTLHDKQEQINFRNWFVKSESRAMKSEIEEEEVAFKGLEDTISMFDLINDQDGNEE
jgi:hypothetical protein